jgi:hypothetical protein
MSNHTKRIVSIMRDILRHQCTFSYMPKFAIDFIFNEGLLELTLWPAWLITTTTRGREYMMTATSPPLVAGESED